MATRQHITSP